MLFDLSLWVGKAHRLFASPWFAWFPLPTDEELVDKQTAFARVPFTSLFYLSQPSAALLSRRRVQIFILFFAILYSQIANRQIAFNDFKVLRFTSLQTRDQQYLESTFTEGDLQLDPDLFQCSKADPYDQESNRNFPSISRFGLLLNGEDVQIPHCTYRSNQSFFISFSFPVEWNGWYFTTSRSADPRLDPVRFIVHGYDGKGWTVVGSSSYVGASIGITFFHAAHATSEARGYREDFDLARYPPGGPIIVSAAAFALFVCGIIQRGELGRLVMTAFFGLWMVVCLRHGLFYYRAGQYEGATLFFALATMYLGNVLLARRERWIATLLWFGACFTMVGAALVPYEYSAPFNPLYFFLNQGLMFLTLGGAMEIGRRRTSSASLSIVAVEMSAYNALWSRLVKSSPASFDDLRRTTHCLIKISEERRCTLHLKSGGFSLKFSASFSRSMNDSDVGTADSTVKLVQTALQHGRRRSSLAELAQGSYRILLADLRLLYSQVRTGLIHLGSLDSAQAPRLSLSRSRPASQSGSAGEESVAFRTAYPMAARMQRYK
jgi:hypothetical protein